MPRTSNVAVAVELQDQRALVTGGTGGIGRAAALLLARAGAEVIISGRGAERGAEVVAAIEAEGGRARFLQADLNDLESVRRMADHVGDVDVLVNNAGIFPFAPTEEQDVASFEELFDVNVRAPFFLAAALLPKMAARGSGSVVNVSTAAAVKGVPGTSVYSATKAALESFTRTWAAEYGASGVRVNTVAPGPTRTDAVLRMLGDGVEELAGRTPLARSAGPEEIAEVILFLASPRSSYVTGATLAADGGMTAV